jgi:hypothetical protein
MNTHQIITGGRPQNSNGAGRRRGINLKIKGCMRNKIFKKKKRFSYIIE